MMNATKLVIGAAIPVAIATGVVTADYMRKGPKHDQGFLPVTGGIAGVGAAAVLASNVVPMSKGLANGVGAIGVGIAAGALAGGFVTALGAILIDHNGY